jgi:DNA invertase Pin-like site-specific DNA recombinase
MIVGYARTSTTDQVAGLEAQLRDLRAAGAEEIYQEQISSMAGERPQLEAALKFVRKGDTLVVAKIDRLARSITKLMVLVEQLSAKGVALRILDPDINTAGPMGKLVLTLLGGIAEFERSIMLERQREGISKAKAEGKFKGRKPTARAKADQVRALRANGAGATEIANRLGIGRQSVYRILDEA